jgi:type IV pilus assembly protein PilC
MQEVDFYYKAIAKDGELKSGVKNTTDEFALKQILKNEGLTLIHAESYHKNSIKNLNSISLFSRVSMHEKIIFCRNLGAMLEAGLPLSRALAIIERQTKNLKLKKIVNDVNEKIKKGGNLSESLKSHSKVFDSLITSMVASGEESGNLVDSLKVISEHLEKQYLLEKKIKGAMVYPGVILSAMIVIGIFMLIYVVPTLTKTFSELNIELPTSTKFIIGLSDFIQNNFVVALVLVALFIFIFYYFKKSPQGKRFFDWLFLHIPTISQLTKEINSSRTTRTLSSLLISGVPFVKSIQITRDVIQNSYYKEVLIKAEKVVEAGLPVSKVFGENSHLYPIFVAEMMAVGEETGEIGPMLLKTALFYEEEVEQKTKNLSTIVEPFLMVVVGAVVGFFAISMISPMYSLVDKI